MLALECPDVGRCEPDGHLDGEGHGVVRQHEALQGLVPTVVVPYRRDHELCKPRGEVLFSPRCKSAAVEKRRRALLEQIVWAARWHGLEEIRDVVAGVLGARAQEGELWLVVGVLVDLAVIELGGADYLRGFDDGSPLFAKPHVRRQIAMLRNPRRERRRCRTLRALSCSDPYFPECLLRVVFGVSPLGPRAGGENLTLDTRAGSRLGVVSGRSP